jgi:peptidoglycan/LPS O-acetylase OafA/YrhL
MENRLNSRYRPDIDGLRAIAVVSVILFHVSYRLLPGGFTGVDIFFVISGFLISGIIATESADGRFSFLAFYVRRMRRILPVFLLVLACTIAVGRVLLLPDDLESLLKSARYGLFFAANYFFSYGRGYFDLASDETPLLHIWSLSVEEQFYFVWPLLLVGLLKLGQWSCGRTREQSRRFVTICVALLVVAAFVYAEHKVGAAGEASRYYFMPQTRASELLVGALAAFAPSLRDRKLKESLSAIGVVAVFTSFFVIDRNTPFPGFHALLPCVGTALLLYAGRGHGEEMPSTQKLLANGAMVFIGRLSYSMYLWHWPILALMRYVYGRYDLPVHWAIGAVAMTLLLSYLSYRFVEQPVKNRTTRFRTAFLGIYALPGAAILLVCFFCSRQAEQVRVDTILTTYGTDVCHGTFAGRCVRGDLTKKPTVLVIGDSHAAALNSFIDVVGRKEGWAAEVVTGSSCSPVFDFDAMALPDFAQKPCEDLVRFVRQNYTKYDVVMIASYWAFQLGHINLPSDKNYLRKFQYTVEQIAASRPVYVFSDVPRLPISPFRLARFESLGLKVKRGEAKESEAANVTIRSAISHIPNVHWVDIASDMQTFDDGCVYNGRPMYFDDQHLNIYGSTALGRRYAQSATLLR